MTDKNRRVPFAINAFLTLGLIAAPLILVICLALPVIMLFGVMKYKDAYNAPVMMDQTSSVIKPEPAAGALGMAGSTCGGPERFPCMPGSICSSPPSEWATSYGTCVTDTRPTYPPGKAGEACDDVHGCDQGLICGWMPGKTKGTCVQNSPKPR